MKHLLTSKTFWFNILAVIAPALAQFAVQMEVIKPFMDPKYYAILLLFVGVSNVLLRRITSEGTYLFKRPVE